MIPPALATLAAALSMLDRPAADTVAALVRPLLEDVAWLDGMIAGLAARSLGEPYWEPPFAVLANGMQTGLLLHRDAHVALFAGVGDHGTLAAKRRGPHSGSIVFTGQLGLVRVIAAGGATLSLWRGGWIDGRPAVRCEAAGRRRLVDGETIVVDGRDTAYLVEHATGDCVLLQAAIAAGAAPAACEYDHATMTLAGLGAARDEPSRRQLLATLLAELDLPHTPAFDAASRMPESFARWHVMRAWASLDAGPAAIRLAEMAADDPDAEVRALARATLPCLG